MTARDRTEYLLRDLAGRPSRGVRDRRGRRPAQPRPGRRDRQPLPRPRHRPRRPGPGRPDSGLVKAVRRFRPGLGQSFAGFAAPTISGEIKRHFRDAGWMVRPPRRLQELGVRIREAEKELEQNAAPPAHHRGDRRRRSVSDPAQVPPRARRRPASTRSPWTCRPAPDQPPTEIVPAGGGRPLRRRGRRRLAEDALGELTDRERLVLRLRFVDVLTQSEIADRIGVSQMQVSRILRSIADPAAPPAAVVARGRGLRRQLPDGRSRAGWCAGPAPATSGPRWTGRLSDVSTSTSGRRRRDPSRPSSISTSPTTRTMTPIVTRIEMWASQPMSSRMIPRTIIDVSRSLAGVGRDRRGPSSLARPRRAGPQTTSTPGPRGSKRPPRGVRIRS